MPSDDILNQYSRSSRKGDTFSMFSHELSDSDSDYEEDLNFMILATFLTKERKKRRYWIHPVNRKREINGEFHCLFNELKNDDEKFHQYFRLSKTEFEEVHHLIEDDIKKIHTRFRKPIGTRERLAICLR